MFYILLFEDFLSVLNITQRCAGLVKHGRALDQFDIDFEQISDASNKPVYRSVFNGDRVKIKVCNFTTEFWLYRSV